MTVEVKLTFVNAAAAAAALAVLAGGGAVTQDATAPAPAADPAKPKRGRPAGKVAEESLGSADAEEAAAEPEQKKKNSGPSVDEISARITELIAAGKKEDVMKLLSKVGGTKASTIPEGKRSFFMDEAAKLLEDTDLTS